MEKKCVPQGKKRVGECCFTPSSQRLNYAKKTQRLSNFFAEFCVNLSALCVKSTKCFCFELSDKIGLLVNLFARNVGFVTRDELLWGEFNFELTTKCTKFCTKFTKKKPLCGFVINFVFLVVNCFVFANNTRNTRILDCARWFFGYLAYLLQFALTFPRCC